MSQGKEPYERYRSLTHEEREQFKMFLEDKKRGSFSDLLGEFLKKARD
jgi:hypothetical protein